MTEDTAAMMAMAVIETWVGAAVWSSNNRWRGP
jgi:hypothetical protein